MPDTAGARNLEEILASIRKSLADESVDGLVQLSAAAAAAARAEAQTDDSAAPTAQRTPATQTAAEALADDLLREKLAGALNTDPDPDLAVEDGDDAAPTQGVDAPEIAHAGAETVHIRPATSPSQSAARAPDPSPEAHSQLWFVRPGAQKDASARPEVSAREVEPIDRATPVPTPAQPASVFALSPRDIIGERRETAESRLKTEADLLSKLRAANAAAIGNMARDAAEAVAPVTSEAAPADSGASADTVDPDAGRDRGPEAEDAADALITRPERSTPLFGQQDDGPRPIVASAGLDLVLEKAAHEAPAAEVAGGTETAGENDIPAAVADLGGAAPVAVDGEATAATPDPQPEALALQPSGPPLEAEQQPDDAAAPVSPSEAAIAAAPDATDVATATGALDATEVSDAAEAPDAPEASGAPEAPEVRRSVDADALAAAAVAPERAAAMSLAQTDTADADAEAAAAPATDDAPAPVAAEAPAGERSLEDMIAAVLEPVLHRLIEKNLGPAIEAIVQREVAKALAQTRDTP